MQEPLEAAIGILHDPVSRLTESEWVYLKHIVKILKPFEEITTEISAEKQITASKVIVMVRGLKNILVKQSKCINDCHTAFLFINKVIDNVNERFRNYEAIELLAKATFLDPRFKSKGFVDSNALKVCKDSILQELKSVCQNDNTITDVQPDEGHYNESSIWGDFMKSVSNVVSNPTSTSIIEMRQYTEDSLLHLNADPLNWWKSRENLHKSLSKLARKYLCIPATSVPSERVFSKTGQIISDRRSRLKPSNVQKIIFLNQNKLN